MTDIDEDKDVGKVLQEKLINAITRELESGNASAGALEVARKFLKDNGVSSFSTGLENPLERLGHSLKALPFVKPDVDPKAM